MGPAIHEQLEHLEAGRVRERTGDGRDVGLGSRLERLAQPWRLRLAAIPPQELDRAEGDAYTPREMASCAVGSRYYAAVGESRVSAG